MMAFRTGRRMLVLGSIVTILAAGALAGGLSFKRSRAHRGAAGAPQGGAVLASTKTKEEPGKTAIPVSVAVIARGPVSSYITSTANLVPEQEVKILAEAEGRVAELHVEEGTRVGRGQILASLAHEDAEIALKKAELRSSNTRSAYERAASLLSDNLVSREAYDRTALESEMAAQELAEARFRLEKTFIRAPFGGHITNREIKLGQHVRPGDTLFTVSDFDPLTARIYLPEKDVYGLQEGRDVRITLKANEATRFHGRDRHGEDYRGGDGDPARGPSRSLRHSRHRPRAARPGGAGAARGGHPRASGCLRLRRPGRHRREAHRLPGSRGRGADRGGLRSVARRAGDHRRPGRTAAGLPDQGDPDPRGVRPRRRRRPNHPGLNATDAATRTGS